MELIGQANKDGLHIRTFISILDFGLAPLSFEVRKIN